MHAGRRAQETGPPAIGGPYGPGPVLGLVLRTRPRTGPRLGLGLASSSTRSSILTRGNPLIWPMGPYIETSHRRVVDVVYVPDQLVLGQG